MTEEQIAIARAMVALEGWEWWLKPRLPVWTDRFHRHGELHQVLADGGRIADWLTDAEQYALAGGPRFSVLPCLLSPEIGGILLEALGSGWSVMHSGEEWHVWGWGHGDLDRTFKGPTLATACARALVARGWYWREG